LQTLRLGDMFCVLGGLDECYEDTQSAGAAYRQPILSPELITGYTEQCNNVILAIVSQELVGLYQCVRTLTTTTTTTTRTIVLIASKGGKLSTHD
jgi:hypothetical protein